MRARPEDITIRRRVDEVQTLDVAVLFRVLGTWIKHQQVWSAFETASGHLLLAVDGTQNFSSGKVNCGRGRVTTHRTGAVTYSHQLVVGAVIHPEQTVSLLLAAEPVSQLAGTKKRDCETAAAKRLFQRLRQPQLRFCVLGEALSSPGPMIQLLLKWRFDFLLAVKPRASEPRLWTYETCVGYPAAKWPKARPAAAQLESRVPDRGTLRYRILRRQPLNATHSDLLVTVIQCLAPGCQQVKSVRGMGAESSGDARECGVLGSASAAALAD